MPTAGTTSRKRAGKPNISPPPKRRRGKATQSGTEGKAQNIVVASRKAVTPNSKKETDNDIKITTAVKVEQTTVKSKSQDTASVTEVKVKRKRKTKEEKEAEAMPLAARTVGSKILAGAHVSAAGGVQNAVTKCNHIGGNAFALFLKSQRQWAFKPLSENDQMLYIERCKEHKIQKDDMSILPVVPHGSYLVNLAHTEKSRADQAYTSFIDDLSRCHRLGIGLYNFHPGNCVGAESRDEALKQLAKQLNKSHKEPQSGIVITLLESMAATGGNTIGSTFEELAEVISLIDDKSRIGVCLDTCHSFAAGYDLRTPETFKATMAKFDSVIGLKYLRALHVNDSKAPLGSGRDLHANLGTGFLGLRAFHNLVNEPRLWGLPFILETPISQKNAEGKDVEDEGVWVREIKLLESLVGMDSESEEFKMLEKELSARGKSERDRVQDQVNRREEKANAKQKKKKMKETQSGSESEEYKTNTNLKRI